MRQRKKGWLSNYLKNKRNSMVLPYINGTVFDFGSKEEVLRSRLPEGTYFSMPDTKPGQRHAIEGEYDTLMLVAVIEHVADIDALFKEIVPHIKKRIIITTPTPAGKHVLEFGSAIGLFHSHNHEEHVHYYSEKELRDLLEKFGFTVKAYEAFQLGLNQIAVGDRLAPPE